MIILLLHPINNCSTRLGFWASMLVSARFNFSKNPAQSNSQTIHPHSLIGFLILHYPQVMSDHLVLSSSRILSSPRCFLLVLFCPLNPTLLLGYKFSPCLVILGVEPDLSPLLQNPIVVAPWIKPALTSLTSVMYTIFMECMRTQGEGLKLNFPILPKG